MRGGAEAAEVGRSVCSGGGSTGRTIGVEEAAEVGGSVGRKEQRPDDRWGGGSRGRTIGGKEAAKVGRPLGRRQQRSDDRCGGGSKGWIVHEADSWNLIASC